MNELWEFLYNFFDYPTVQGLVSGIIATIVGVALGIPVAFWINRLGEARTEKEKKTKILGVLLDELDTLLYISIF